MLAVQQVWYGRRVLTETAARTSSVRTQKQRTALSYDRLLAAASKLIAECGYDRISLDMIGKEAGYSRGLVSHRFGSKEGLLWALVENMFERWSTKKVAPAVGEQVGVAALHAAIDAIRPVLESTPNQVRAFYALLFQAVGNQPALRARVAEFHRRERTIIEKWIRKGIRQGTVRPDVDAAGQAALFVSAVRGAGYLWLLDPESVDLPALHGEIKAIFARNLQVTTSPNAGNLRRG